MNILFHCDEKGNFKNPEESVRAFSYTDYAIDPHNHDFYEMNIVLGGTGIHEIEGESFPVKRGDVFVIPPSTVHAYYNTESLEVYHILFKKSFIRKEKEKAVSAPGFLKLMEIEPFLRQKYSEAMFLHLDHSEIKEIQEDLKILDEKSLFNSEKLLPLIEHTAWKLIYHLSYLLEKQTASDKKIAKSKYYRQILASLEYLNCHFSEKITISELSGRLFLSRSTFLRSFKAVCGCSPTEYLSAYRIKKAIELSESGELSKTEIAHLCGFYDLSHMERSIKKAGDYPTECYQKA